MRISDWSSDVCSSDLQTIFGNYPMLARWLSHRWLLGQSMSFFQDEFAGRVAQKVMQTALAIRETVTKLMDVLVYVIVYFRGAMLLLGQADPWLTAQLLAWLALYLAIVAIFLPPLPHSPPPPPPPP